MALRIPIWNRLLSCIVNQGTIIFKYRQIIERICPLVCRVIIFPFRRIRKGNVVGIQCHRQRGRPCFKLVVLVNPVLYTNIRGLQIIGRFCVGKRCDLSVCSIESFCICQEISGRQVAFQPSILDYFPILILGQISKRVFARSVTSKESGLLSSSLLSTHTF